ncbi:hypothetical protein [Streptomyces sp. NPDC006285]|uniref:hypothetical protein n=1 Tax=Streptomyces sp. NPDC006285 TaxID=3364742 RepID=UPI0036CDA542
MVDDGGHFGEQPGVRHFLHGDQVVVLGVQAAPAGLDDASYLRTVHGVGEQRAQPFGVGGDAAAETGEDRWRARVEEIEQALVGFPVGRGLRPPVPAHLVPVGPVRRAGHDLRAESVQDQTPGRQAQHAGELLARQPHFAPQCGDGGGEDPVGGGP